MRTEVRNVLSSFFGESYPLSAHVTSARQGVLSPIARIYLSGICLLGLFVILQPPQFPLEDTAVFVAFFILCGLGQLLPIRFFNNSSISLSMVMAMAAIFVCGPVYAVWVNLASGLIHLVTGVHKRRPLYRSAVTISVLTITAWTAGQVYVALGGQVGPDSDYFQSVLPGVFSAATYFLINTFLIASAIAFEQRQGLRALWSKNREWLNFHFARMGLLAFAVAVFYQKLGFVGLGLFLLPIVMAWYSTRLYERTVEDVNKANAELVQASDQVRETNEQLKDANERLNIMYEVSRSLVGSLYLEETLSSIAAATRMMGFTAGFVAGLDNRQEKFSHWHGVKAAYVKWVLTEPDVATQTKLYQVIASLNLAPSFLAGNPYVVRLAERGILNSEKDAVPISTLMPLFIHGEIWGVVGIGSVDSLPGMMIKELLIFRSMAESALEMALAHEQAERDATIDAGTGLYNHGYFQDTLQRELQNASQRNSFLSLLMIDINNFKEFNDLYGHPVGDQVLQSVAQILCENIRRGDIACRYGGDEMCVVLPHTDRARAMEIAFRIDEAIRAYPFHIRRELGSLKTEIEDPSLRVSIGLATFPEGAHTRAGLIEQADRACYRAKALGGGVASEGAPKETDGQTARLQLVKRPAEGNW
ncbi:MAG: GGDEF domain-containing protein [Chloroflexota bacterium]|nr:GGDEF domain-containing protein [Chloroflexota bacterium]